MSDLISRQPEQRTLTEDDYAYCMNCDHVEMCRWYPMYGCEFKSRPSAQSEITVCADCKHWICHDRRCGYWNHGVKPLDWCCHAERRTDEE